MKDMQESARRILNYEAEAIQLASKNIDVNFSKTIDMILNNNGRLVVCGMGKSGLIGRKISATLSSTGTPSFFLHPSEALHGDLGMVRENDVVLLLSNSGETEEIIRIVPFLRRIGTNIVAMVGEPESSLAKMSDLVINAHVEREACPLNLAPTSSTTVALALGDAIAGALIEARNFTQRDFARFHPSGSLGRRFISVKDLMHTGEAIPKIKGEVVLREAIVLMSQFGFGALVVCDDSDKLLGVFTDGDLRRFFNKVVEANLELPIKDVMTVNPKFTTPNKLAMEALKIMEDKSITSLPVTEDGIVVGFLHLHDILRSRLV